VNAAGFLGGAERSLVELAGAISPDRFQLFAAVGAHGPLADSLMECGVRVEVVEMPRLRRTVNPLDLAGMVAGVSRSSRRLADLARDLGIELIVSNGAVSHVVAGEAAARARRPCVWHARDMVELGPLTRRMLETASLVIAVSAAAREHLLREGARPERVRLVRNGIGLSAFPEGNARESARSRARRELGLSEQAFVVGSAGAFVPWKRHEDFIRAFARLCELELDERKRRPQGAGSTVVEFEGLVPARAVLFGADLWGDQGRLAFELRRLADELTGERIVFPGWREDLPRLLPALDCFVSTSEREPFGRAVVEAMASGLPVVATDSGGKRETVVDGETGLLVPQGDVEAVARATDRLRRDPARRAEMGRAARRRAFAEFSLERAAREVEAVWTEALQASGRPGD